MIRHEEGIELGSLELLDKAFDMFEIEIGVWVRAGIPPGSGMQTDLHRPATEPSASVVMTGWVTTRSYRPHECGEVVAVHTGALLRQDVLTDPAETGKSARGAHLVQCCQIVRCSSKSHVTQIISIRPLSGFDNGRQRAAPFIQSFAGIEQDGWIGSFEMIARDLR
nr:hypothetical protein CFP56_76217 [Quercus suber]